MFGRLPPASRWDKTLGLSFVNFQGPKKMHLASAVLSQQVARMTTWTSASKAAIPIYVSLFMNLYADLCFNNY